MSEGSPRARSRRPLAGQPTLIPEAGRSEESAKQKPFFWMGVVPNLNPLDKEEGKYVKLFGYEEDGRKVVRDEKGRERTIDDPAYRLDYEREARRGTATAETTREVNAQYGGGVPKPRK